VAVGFHTWILKPAIMVICIIPIAIGSFTKNSDVVESVGNGSILCDLIQKA